MQNIVVKGLGKRFSDKRVLDDFSCLIEGGKVTCLMGESGCGKTTLLRILSGLEDKDAGDVSGINKKRLAFVFQEDRLIPHLSALENCILPLVHKNAKEKGVQALTALGLDKDIHTRVTDLSGGMARRVAIARALIADAETVFMDEPFKGLDEQTRKRVVEYVKKALEGKTALIVTHDSQDASDLNASIIHMKTLAAGQKSHGEEKSL
ncbi:MAG: ABC transporter ATP-binding protein [Clostridia bacterium]|nr:ABC transporter ATP-binding protein [Clostridia bacterium]MBQ4158255.1 ABC transporter ATP-binding protein [Clostridia bacterium]